MPRLFALLIISSFVLSPLAVQARDQNSVITDRELTDAATMDLGTIDRFLKNKGALGYKFVQDTDGVTRTPGEILWRVATTYSINPQFLLALMQKEQSLVDATRPIQDALDWATGYGVCDGCAKTDPGLARFRGFAKQIEGAARQIREEYLPRIAEIGTTLGGFGPGRPKRVDGVVVIPANAATAAMYTYTPHLHGNQLLGDIWDKWFKKKFPEGSLLKTDNGTIYLLINAKLRRIASQKVFRTIGFNPEEVEEVSEDDLLGLEVGDPITTKSVYPQGALVQNKKTGGVYFVQDGKKHAIWSRELLQMNYGGLKMFKVAPTELAEYESGPPTLFPDGSLVQARGSDTVYLISTGTRRPLRDRETITALGMDPQDVIITTDKALNLHPLGAAIEPSIE